MADHTPAAQWRVKGEPDPHDDRYACERAALTLGHLSDDELANGAFLNYDRRPPVADMLSPKPGQHMPIVWMTAVKDRIRWLSRRLVGLQALADEYDALIRHMDAGGDFTAFQVARAREFEQAQQRTHGVTVLDQHVKRTAGTAESGDTTNG